MEKKNTLKIVLCIVSLVSLITITSLACNLSLQHEKGYEEGYNAGQLVAATDDYDEEIDEIPDAPEVEESGEDDVLSDGYCSESQAEEIMSDLYIEGYNDACAGVEAAYLEVTEDTVDISDSFNEYGVYTEDDVSELSALYYTSGYHDAVLGRSPEYSDTDQESVQEPEATQPEEPSQSEPQSVAVYVTNTGVKYHMDGCQYLSKSKNAISLSSAKAAGYTPCSRCHPPQ